jgi:hypothetical protein
LGLPVAFGQNWSSQTPRLKWERRPLEAAEATLLLARVCAAGVESTFVRNEQVVKCYEQPQPERSGTENSLPARRFNPSELNVPKPVARPEQIWFNWVSTVIYGHFLAPSSEDAALSGWAGETHPEFWGGTLLLTKKNGEWQPVWYKHAVITRYCQKLKAATGRDVLLCEEEDGGMGHSYHILFVVDFTTPESPWDAAIFTVDSYVLMCREQQVQTIDRITFDAGAQLATPFMTIFARHGRRHLSQRLTEECSEDRLRSSPTLRDYRIDFVLRDSLTPTPQSAQQASALFKVR